MTDIAFEPLGEDQFRLFKLKIDVIDIDLEVKVFPISDPPPYKAISYYWGKREHGFTFIKRNGAPFEVWSSLHAYLQRAKSEGHDSWSWVDAVCIEQGDSHEARHEKKRQIACMDIIFRSADLVKVWLGDASPEEENALKVFYEVYSQVARNPNYDISKNLPGSEDKIWRYWTQFILRPYFSRVWIVQEVIPNQSKVVFMLGNKFLAPFRDFKSMFWRISNVPWILKPQPYPSYDNDARVLIDQAMSHRYKGTLGFEYTDSSASRTAPHIVSMQRENRKSAKRHYDTAIRLILQRCQHNMITLLSVGARGSENTNHRALHNMLDVYSHRHCTYNQDRPNAMRAILPSIYTDHLKVYDVNTDVRTVYRETSRVWLQADLNISLLSLIGRFRDTFLHQDVNIVAYDLSWTVDLEHIAQYYLNMETKTAEGGYHAGLLRAKDSESNMTWTIPDSSFPKSTSNNPNVFFPDDRQCWVSGRLIGKVVPSFYTWAIGFVRDRDLEFPISANHFEVIKSGLANSFNLIQKAIPDLDTAAEVHWRTLVFNHAMTSSSHAAMLVDVDNEHSLGEDYNALMTVFKHQDSRAIVKDERAAYFFGLMFTRNWKTWKNWFALSLGHVARSVAMPSIDDVVAVFNGAHTPFILRPVPGEGTFKLLGEVYVHGIMQGEAFFAENEDKYPQTVFKLI